MVTPAIAADTDATTQPGLTVHEGLGQIGHQEEQRSDRERCREREDAEDANHPRSVGAPAVSKGTGRRY